MRLQACAAAIQRAGPRCMSKGGWTETIQLFTYKTKHLLLHPAAEACETEYTAARVYHDCMQMLLIGLVHPLKETQALFASDIKAGSSERSSLLQSRQEEKPMHNAPLWTEDMRAMRLLAAHSSNSIHSASPITSLSDSCDERRRQGGRERHRKKSHYCLNVQSVWQLQ